MADIDLKTETPDTSLPTTGFLFGADSQAAASPSVFTTQAVATTLLGSTTLSGATITADAPVLNMSQTWNAGGVTFTGLKFNATDTASAAASLLMDLQVGGGSVFSIAKTGDVTLRSPSTSVPPRLYLENDNNAVTASFYQTGGVLVANAANARFVVEGLSGSFGIGSTPSAPDLIFGRRAAANLRFGAADAAAPVAQTLSVQSVVAGTTNTAGANLTITGSQGTGTGAGGSIIFQVAPAGSSGTAQNALATALTIAGNRVATFTGSEINVGGSTHYFRDLNSGAPKFLNGTTNCVILLGNTSSGNIPGLFVTSNTTEAIGWLSGNYNNLPDLTLHRDAANTLAQRNGTNAQAFNIYNTFTDASNYERLATYWAGNTAYILSASAGTGVARNLVVGTALSSTLAFWTAAVERWQINTSGHFLAGADNTYDIGASGANRPRVVYAGVIAATSSLRFTASTKMAAPSDGVLNLTDSAGTDFNRLQFGGTTSSFPALKRSTTVLQTRLADDSAFATIQGKLRADVNAVAETPTATHTITITDAAGTAYKVLCVAA